MILVASKSMRRVRDSIHDYIDLNKLESSLVDTEPYQRLRWIKQLGSANLVYPGANHTRLEHGIGTGHLVTQMAKQSGCLIYTSPSQRDRTRDRMTYSA